MGGGRPLVAKVLNMFHIFLDSLPNVRCFSGGKPKFAWIGHFFTGSYVGQNVVLPMRGYSTDGVCGLQFAQWTPFNYLLLNRGQSSHHLRPIIRGHYRRVIITCTPVFIKPYVLLNCT